MNYYETYLKQINKSSGKNNNIFDLYLEIYNLYLENAEKVKRFFPDLDQAEIDKVAEFDPTSVKSYTKWLLLKAKKNNEPKYFSIKDNEVIVGEDAYKVEEYLTIFDRVKNKPNFQGLKNIDQYKTISNLYDNIKDFKIEDLKKSKTELLDSDEVEKIYEDNSWLMITPKTYEASCKFGKGTEWCTATEKTREHYDKHSKESPLYILIDKTDKTNKYQFQFHEGGLLADKDDEDIRPFFWVKENNIPQELMNKLNELDPKERFVNPDTLSGEEKIKAVMNNYGVSKYTVNNDGSIDVHQDFIL